MKSNEFLVNGVVKENWFYNALARAGKLGDKARQSYWKTQDEGRIQANFYKTFQIQLQQFLNTIQQLAENTLTYDYFNKLLESAITNEVTGTTFEDSIKRWMLNKLRREEHSISMLTSDQQNDLDDAINQFAAGYRASNKVLNTQLSNILANAYWRIYNEGEDVAALAQARAQQAQQQPKSATPLDAGPDEAHWKAYKAASGNVIPSTGKGSGQPIKDEPELSIPVRGSTPRVFKYDFSVDAWMDVTNAANPREMADAATIQKLNDFYYDWYFGAAPAPAPAPTP